MLCPSCKSKNLISVLTKQGVEIDYCESCKSIWLDKGEIFYFTRKPTYLRQELDQALRHQTPSDRHNPKTNSSLKKIQLFGLSIDYDPVSGGMWLDGKELEKLAKINHRNLSISIDKEKEQPRKEQAVGLGTALSPLPGLFLPSSITLLGLYAILVFVLILLVQFFQLDVFFALSFGVFFAIMQFLLSPFLMDLSLRFFYKMRWMDWLEVPDELRKFIETTCDKVKMKYPRIGLIEDDAPQAFTYGHHPNNARIVLSQGIFSLLNEDEVEAVVAHEIGHAIHWDMLLMTIAGIVPLILYYIYRTLIRSKGSGKGKGQSAALTVAIISYILYIISEYLVLWFSRVREYYADRFSGRITNDPNSLASALVKI
ncbi:M48 family metalloprotease, partial [Candidatus Margulisiibacteriota bacterium]